MGLLASGAGSSLRLSGGTAVTAAAAVAINYNAVWAAACAGVPPPASEADCAAKDPPPATGSLCQAVGMDKAGG